MKITSLLLVIVGLAGCGNGSQSAPARGIEAVPLNTRSTVPEAINEGGSSENTPQMLLSSQPKMWRYNLVWNKCRTTGFLNAKRMPLRSHEDICVFYRKLPTYNPQMEDLNGRDPNHSQGFGAAVPICGDINPDRLGKFEGVSFSLYHGDSDPNVPVAGSRDAYRALKAAGADVRYHEFPGCGHVCWWKAFEMPDFMEWMFSKSKRKSE